MILTPLHALILAACTASTTPKDTDNTADSASDTSSGATGTYELTVRSGYGGGRYAAGEVVHVWADLDPQGEWLPTWLVPEGSAPLFDATEWNSDLLMPDGGLTIEARAEPVEYPLSAASFVLASGKRYALEWLPDDPRALVLFFHGASYNHTQIQSNAGTYLAHLLANDGYALVAFDSAGAARSGAGGWNDDVSGASNEDLDAVREIVTALRGDGSIGAATPVVAMGMSSGGQFAHAVGEALPADAVLAFCAPGQAATLAETVAPTAWFLAENDSTFPTGADDAAAAAAELDARGVPNLLSVHPPTPLYDQRFERVAGVDPALSAAIAADIRAAGFVDDDDRWLVSGATVSASVPFPSMSGLDADDVVAVDAEIEVMAAEHELYEDYASRMKEFLRRFF